MGNTCGGVAGNCCSNESNVDLNGQIEGVNNARQKSTLLNQYGSNPNSGMKNQNKVDIIKIMSMPETSKER